MKHLVLILMLILFPVQSIYAAIEGASLSIEDVVATVLEENPEYKAHQEKVEAFHQQSWIASSWEDPRVGVRFNMTPRNEFLTNARQRRWFIMQKFPFPGKLTLKGNAAEKQADIEKINLEGMKFTLMKKTKKAYYQLYFLNKSIEINQEHQRLLDKFQKIANRKYSVGTASQQDVLKAMVELARLSNDLITLEQVKKTRLAQLNALMNRAPSTPLGDPTEPVIHDFDYTLDQLEQMALESKQAVQAASVYVKKRKDDRFLSYLSYAPDFFTRWELWETRNKDKEWGAEFGITIPLWFWNRQIPQVKKSTARLNEAKLKLQHTKNETLFQVTDTYVRVNTALRLINLYKTTVLTQAKQSLRAAESGYQADKVDFLNLIESQRVLENFKLEYYRAQTNFAIALAELEEAVGRSL